MHVVFRESHGLEETATPTDLGQSPADLVVLSFSDSDLGAFAEGWHNANGKLPTLRLANLAALKHPLSVDTYIEQTLCGAKGILIRLIGGVPYWEYGLNQVRDLAQRNGLALAVLPADGRPDTRLDDYSTLPVSTLRRLSHLCDTGGATAAQAALAQLSLAAGLYAGPVRGNKSLPFVGAWTPEHGVCCPMVRDQEKPLIAITFYRSYLVAADLAPIKAMFEAFRAKGYEVIGLFAPSLKAPDAAGWLARQLKQITPAAIVNATAFSGRGVNGTSPLDATDAPVFQVALTTADFTKWDEAERGMSPSDLAMHVVLPEVDGRLFAGLVSTKEPSARDAHLEFARYVHTPVPARVTAVAERVDQWVKLAKTKAPKVAVVLSTYPGKDWQIAHAVGLDALASTAAVVTDAGLAATEPADISDRLLDETIVWPLDQYCAALSDLPAPLQRDLAMVWGNASEDDLVQNGAFHFPAFWHENALIALQPERGTPKLRDEEYHDLARIPRHSYVAFYLWLHSLGIDAIIHMGAHGTLEWLPGKAVALSDTCWPEALIQGKPVIYPFIVNDPGEAAQAKRRIGAVTLGHVPPPLRQSGTPEKFVPLETLLDEFSNADGLDPKRRDRLKGQIRDMAVSLGVEADLGITDDMSEGEALTRIDRFVCDVKEAQYGDGLHVYGRVQEGALDPNSAESERNGLIRALQGQRISSGPSGSPYRGRNDVLPTGRNLYTTDPLSVPTRASFAQGVILADEFVRRHLQDNGDWPRGVIVDLWGSATMRTAGEEFAMALALLGVKPVWNDGSERVSGIEVIPITEMDRPRIDVTLRVSGLFRDVFPTLSTLFNQAIRVLSERDEASDWNPYAGTSETARVYGPAPGAYGLDMGHALEDYSEQGRADAGQNWLRNSSWAIDGEYITQDRKGIEARVEQSDSFIHLQDLAETDVLMAADYAAHEAGFAAAKTVTGGQAALYHIDNTNPAAPKARTLKEEIAKTVLARASNPNWIAGMQRHGFRGAAEIAATLDHMGSFANLAGLVEGHLFDAYYMATLGDDDVAAFLRDANPLAYQSMLDRFNALAEAGLWISRRNSISHDLETLRQEAQA